MTQAKVINYGPTFYFYELFPLVVGCCRVENKYSREFVYLLAVCLWLYTHLCIFLPVSRYAWDEWSLLLVLKLGCYGIVVRGPKYPIFYIIRRPLCQESKWEKVFWLWNWCKVNWTYGWTCKQLDDHFYERDIWKSSHALCTAVWNRKWSFFIGLCL